MYYYCQMEHTMLEYISKGALKRLIHRYYTPIEATKTTFLTKYGPIK